VSFYGWPNADKFLTAYRVAGFRVAGHFVFPAVSRNLLRRSVLLG
jgi:hypothetical protein